MSIIENFWTDTKKLDQQNQKSACVVMTDRSSDNLAHTAPKGLPETYRSYM